MNRNQLYLFLLEDYWQSDSQGQNNYELRSLLRSFGEQIEVMAPASLREMMKDSADAVSKMYNDSESKRMMCYGS